MRTLDEQQAREFLMAEPRTAVLATTNEDGSPHAVPVWFALDDSEMVMILTGDTRKVDNLQRDPRAALCVEDERPPFGFVELRGTCNLRPDAADLYEWAHRMAVRYMGEERADEIAAVNSEPGEVLVRFRPQHTAAVVDLAA